MPKLTDVDYLEALVRNPEFLKDWEKWKTVSANHDPLSSFRAGERGMENLSQRARVHAEQDLLALRFQKAALGWPPRDPWIVLSSLRERKSLRAQHDLYSAVTPLLSGSVVPKDEDNAMPSISLRIALLIKPLDDLLRELTEHVTAVHRIVDKPRVPARKKPQRLVRKASSQDKWDTYDRVKRGEAKLQIAKKMERCHEGTPAYNPDLERTYRNILRQYEHAETLIEQAYPPTISRQSSPKRRQPSSLSKSDK